MNKTDATGKRARAVARKSRRVARLGREHATNVAVTFRHLESTDAIRVYAEKRFAHIGRLLKRDCDIHLILLVDKYRHHGEVTVKSGRLLATAQEETKDLYSVIDLLAEKVGSQLKRHLKKIEAKKVRSPSTGTVLTASEES